MKKLFLGLLAAAAVTFTACQKDEVINEVPQDQPIEFGTYVGRDAQTKASEQTESTLQGVGFGVYAYYTDTEDYTQNSLLNFLWDEHVTYSASQWGYTNTKYWPSVTGKKFTFIAYAPANNNNITEKPSKLDLDPYKGDPKFTFTVNGTVTEQTDLLYASIENYTTIENNGVQNFTFNHALSRIGFSAKPANENDKISITGISIKGRFTKNAKFNVRSGVFTTPINNSEEITYTPIVKNDEISGSSPVSITENGNYIMIIPTEKFKEANPGSPTNPDNITITVNYTIQIADNNIKDGYAAAVPKTEIGTIDHIVFEKGKAYNIVLTVSPSDPIKFGVESVTNWYTDPSNPVEDVEVTATPA